MVGYGQGQVEAFSHAYALLSFKNRPGYVLIQDMNNPMGAWGDKRPPNDKTNCAVHELFELFDHFHQLQLYAFEERLVFAAERDKLELELGFIMSGKHDEEKKKAVDANKAMETSIKRKRRRGGALSNKKEKAQWKRYHETQRRQEEDSDSNSDSDTD